MHWDPALVNLERELWGRELPDPCSLWPGPSTTDAPGHPVQGLILPLGA